MYWQNVHPSFSPWLQLNGIRAHCFVKQQQQNLKEEFPFSFCGSLVETCVHPPTNLLNVICWRGKHVCLLEGQTDRKSKQPQSTFEMKTFLLHFLLFRRPGPGSNCCHTHPLGSCFRVTVTACSAGSSLPLQWLNSWATSCGRSWDLEVCKVFEEPQFGGEANM